MVDGPRLRAELARFRGSPVVVIFWASWCPSCIEELPTLVEAARTYRSRGVRFVAVSADDPKEIGSVKKALERFGAPFDAILIATDPDSIIPMMDGQWNGALPATFLLDGTGKQLRKSLAPVDRPTLDTWLKPL